MSIQPAAYLIQSPICALAIKVGIKAGMANNGSLPTNYN